MFKVVDDFCKLLCISVFMFALFSCDNDIKISNSVYWKNSSTVNATAGFADIAFTGAVGDKWTATISQGSDWCTFGSTNTTLTAVSGFITNDDNYLRIYFTTNYSATARNASIVFKFEGEDAQTFLLKQTTAYTAFTESPVRIDNDDYKYATHYVTLNNKTVRNYSICFDTSKKSALWVAYPIHPAYSGSSSRTDEWAFDPSILPIYQSNCVLNSYGGNYDRGHQIASADRLATREMNAQTFYMTNITPQLNRLNQDMWAKLEIKVRTHSCADTLFVVTGAWHDASSTATTSDGSGSRIPLPTHYFKVLLRTTAGSTGKAIVNCSDSELKSIGFWVEHRSYGNIEPPRSICMSVADIEAKTGLKFFPILSEAVKKQNNPAQWGL